MGCRKVTEKALYYLKSMSNLKTVDMRGTDVGIVPTKLKGNNHFCFQIIRHHVRIYFMLDKQLCNFLSVHECIFSSPEPKHLLVSL